MTVERERTSDLTMTVTISALTEEALVRLCEAHGWSMRVALELAIADGVRALRDDGERGEAADQYGSTNRSDTVLYAIVARLCAENTRLCAENARLREWVEQCRTGRAPGIPTVDAPSPAWLWRYRPGR